jgi:peptidylprolyl isomerase
MQKDTHQKEFAMTQAKSGDTVKVNYTCRVVDGPVFDSTQSKEPLEFQLGAGQIIQGFEKSIVGMQPGETKTIDLPPEEAYGNRREDMVVAIERSNIPENVELQVGRKLYLQRQDGLPVEVTLTEVTESRVVVDANHPLAGRPVTFDIELLEIA